MTPPDAAKPTLGVQGLHIRKENSKADTLLSFGQIMSAIKKFKQLKNQQQPADQSSKISSSSAIGPLVSAQ